MHDFLDRRKYVWKINSDWQDELSKVSLAIIFVEKLNPEPARSGLHSRRIHRAYIISLTALFLGNFQLCTPFTLSYSFTTTNTSSNKSNGGVAASRRTSRKGVAGWNEIVGGGGRKGGQALRLSY